MSPLSLYSPFLISSEKAERTPGAIEDLTDLIAEDWSGLGRVREMGAETAKFFCREMERTWGSKHLAVFSEKEARNWVLGVSMSLFPFGVRVRPRGHVIRQLTRF